MRFSDLVALIEEIKFVLLEEEAITLATELVEMLEAAGFEVDEDLDTEALISEIVRLDERTVPPGFKMVFGTLRKVGRTIASIPKVAANVLMLAPSLTAFELSRDHARAVAHKADAAATDADRAKYEKAKKKWTRITAKMDHWSKFHGDAADHGIAAMG